MGAVHAETQSQGKNIHEFDNLHYGDPVVIEYMIRNRSTIDASYLGHMFHNPNPFYASDIVTFKEMICVMYVDLDNLIKTSDLTDVEQMIVKKLMMGYSDKDIHELFLKEGKVQQILKSSIVKIKKKNDEDELDALETRGVKVNTKVCTRCGMKKLISEYRLNKTSSDGKRSICKECESK